MQKQKWRRAWKAAVQELMPAGLVQLICMLIASPETTFCRADTAALTASLFPLGLFLLLPYLHHPIPLSLQKEKFHLVPKMKQEIWEQWVFYGVSTAGKQLTKWPLGPRHTKGF